MNLPGPDDYIDIHNHGAKSVSGIYSIETLMAHEHRLPEPIPGLIYSVGIHPWHLSEQDYDKHLEWVRINAEDPDVAAIGEAGFDKLKGASPDLQKKAFREQSGISEQYSKPLVIHCVRSWEELLNEHKIIKPGMPWLVHGFRGKPELALQLIARGIYISLWFDFAIRDESVTLLQRVPRNRLFLETDGSGVNIRDIYEKVSANLGISTEELKHQTRNNFFNLFGLSA